MRARDLVALELDPVRQRVADFAHSPTGKQACRQLQPSNERAVVQSALEATYQCTRLLETCGDLPLGEFPDVRAAIRTATHEGFVLDGKALVEIRSVLDAAVATRSFLKQHVAPFPQLTPLPERIDPQRELHATLRRALDDNGDVSDDASDELAAVRRELRHLRQRLQRKLEDMLTRPGMADLISDQYVTVRNNRFVLPIKTVWASQFEGVVQDRSVSGETMFIEPLFAVELNNRLLMAAKEEERLVRRILADLTELVRAEHVPLLETFAALTEVDALAARARFSLHYRCTQPRLDDDEILLRAARHPILLFGEGAITPIDVLLPRGKQVLVVTGPNTGGKTVALKTLGLLALMAQSGLLIPAAEGSCLPCFAAVFADVGDEQSITRNLSTFSAHIANLTDILSHRQRPAIVLLDEPGVGTDPEEGAALGIGMIRLLEARGVRVAVTTHYAAIKVFALGDDACVIAAVDFDLASLTPKYRLVYQSVGESLALPIARRLGLPEDVIDAAQAARSTQSRALETAMERLEETRRRYEERLAEVEARDLSVKQSEEQAAKLLAELQAKRKQRWASELEEAREFLRTLKQRGAELLAAIERGAADRRRLREFLDEQEVAVAAHREIAIEAPQPTGRAPQVGDQVEVIGQAIRGQLLSVEGDRAWIQRGSMRFEVPSAALRGIEGKGTAPRVDVRLPFQAEETSPELSLLGLRVKDAIAELQHFLDRAAQARLASVRIIHGIGSGALRKAVADYLSTSPYCSSFRGADPQHGGAGVTVADLSV
ncbi:MAG: endonuclease MutS2 [Deltaproteobacteria bacterium]|nr:endonuclease MutS2 [Deltaproteobacteria bacterium]